MAAGVPDRILADSHRLAQVLMNLVGNALKFTHEGGISVRVSLAEGAAPLVLHVEVRDTGIGIPPEKQAQVFEPFRQADNSTTRKYGGTGLGLSISAHVVEAMGGRLWLESAVGQGSTFHFTVRAGLAAPAHEGAAPPRGATSAQDDLVARIKLDAGRDLRPLRILLAEDNRINQRLAMALLERDGHSVTVVDNGRGAVEAAVGATFDAILMDVEMPELSGLEAAAAIRAHEGATGAHVPIVAMTAHAMQGDRERCLAAGMDAYLTKPIAPDAIRRALAEFEASGLLAPCVHM